MPKTLLCLALLVVLAGCIHQSRDSLKDVEPPRTDCDDLAASPMDPGRKADGVAFDQIDAGKALDACLAATAQYPDSPRLHFQLGRVYAQGKRFDEAATEYRTAAEAGNAPAQYNLGLMYATGDGVAKDETQAADWYRKAAEQGLAVAQYNLGFMYDKGRGVPKDSAQAAVWYQKAAEQGDDSAKKALRLLENKQEQ